ncbi:MAG: hypothetical protein M3211_07700, partial [Actinomycetota bacterium]|nr:hypothetical protein [Actinomycetota bacterium]
MGTGGLRWLGRAMAVVGACALVGASPGVAQADTRYDGEATALRIEGLQLQLFPAGLDALPEQLQPLVEEIRNLQSEAPPELQREGLTLKMPEDPMVIGHAEYEGTDTQGEIPPNPLVTAELLEARSVPTKGGGMLSEASVTGLSIGGGALTADVIRTQCRGDGDRVGLDVSHLELGSNGDALQGRVSLPQGQAVRVAGIGRLTFGQRDTDGTTYGEATNVIIDLDTDLSLQALNRIFDQTAPDLENAMQEVIKDLKDSKMGGEGGGPTDEQIESLTGERLYRELDRAVEQITAPAQENLPDEAQNALNNLAHLGGTITISNAACAQQPVAADTSAPSRPQQAVPADPAAQSRP